MRKTVQKVDRTLLILAVLVLLTAISNAISDKYLTAWAGVVLGLLIVVVAIGRQSKEVEDGQS